MALAVAVALGLALMFLILPGALAEDPTPEPTTVPNEPLLGDCYGGVLFHAPLHCYALEQAEAAGVIDVDSIYLAGSRLYVFVGGEVGERVSALTVEVGNPTVGYRVYEGIGEEMKEYARLWPGRVDIQKNLWPRVCDPGDSDADCLLKKLQVDVEVLLDDIENYDSLYLRAGTQNDRSKVRGGAGWTRLWPGVQQGEGQRDVSPSSFDVSDVDTTNFTDIADIDCRRHGGNFSCGAWRGNAARGINGVVGVRSTSEIIGEGVAYIQLHKDPSDPAAYEAAKTALLQHKPEDWPEWVIIPVKYSFPDLWKWGMILDRFAKSRGNTIGILSANNHNTGTAAFGRSQLGLYRDVETGVWREGQGTSDLSLIRETVSISALDPYVVRDALPVLLPQLGIPIDAVGFISQRPQKRQQIDTNVDTSSSSEQGESGAGDQTRTEADTDRMSIGETPESADLTTDTPGGSSGPPQDSKVQSPNTVEVTQPDSLTGVPVVPSMDTPMPDAEDGSVLSPWVLILIVGGVVAIVLVVLGLTRNRLRRRAS